MTTDSRLVLGCGSTRISPNAWL